MSKDIRSFFRPANKKPHEETSRPKPINKKVVISSSDEEDVLKPIQKKQASKRQLIDSDDEDQSPKQYNPKKKINFSKIIGEKKEEPKKFVDVKNLFGETTIKRVNKQKPVPKKINTIIDSDEELERSILECEKQILGNYEDSDSSHKTPIKDILINNPKKSSEKSDKISDKIHEKVIEINDSPNIKVSSKSKSSKTRSCSKTPEKNITALKDAPIEKVPLFDDDDGDIIPVTPPSSTKRNGSKSSKNKGDSRSPEKNSSNKLNAENTPKQNVAAPNKIIASTPSFDEDVIAATPQSSTQRKRKNSSAKRNESTAQDDEDRHEKKRLCAILYQKFKNRSSVINPGSKPLPKGKPNCLAGKTFVVTGILESLERDEASKLIEEYGGKVVSAVTKKTSFVVVGEEAGPMKISKAESLRIKQLTEDDLFELINKTLKGEKKKEETDHKPKTEVKSPNKNIEIEKKENLPKKMELKTSPTKNSENNIKKELGNFKIKNEQLSPLKSEEKTLKKEDANVKSIKSIKIENNISDKTLELPWVEKYKPSSCSQIVGQQGAASNCVKLKNWLQKWHSNHNGKKKLQKPNPWAKNDDGAFYKAALLSGPPGIGKTTTVNLVCKELGLDLIEFNASDTRSKKLLKEEVSELLSNKSLAGYFHGDKNGLSKNHVLVMDEVDGMAGNEDRGGIQELIGLIKDSSIPIICMCNDRNHQKMRSLVNYCYDLRFSKPRVEQIKAAMMSVLFKEKFKIPPNILGEIITSSNHDIRQTLNHLSMLNAKKELLETSTSEAIKKDIKMGPWDVVRKVFSAEDHKSMSIYDKSDLFFNDYSLAPLFVQQNYLAVAPHAPKSETLDRVADAADSLSMGDLVEKRIRSNMAWSLLPVQAMFSSVLPGHYMEGHFTGQINFPAWLGKFSKTNKRKRLAQEVHDHTRIRTSASALSFNMDYAPLLVDSIIRPLKEKGVEGVPDSLEIIKEYRLLREDIDSMIELSTWPGKKNPFDGIDGKIKAALTRAYNKEVCPYTYTATAAIKKIKSDKTDEFELDGDNENLEVLSSDDEEDDKIDNDVFIKAKKLSTLAGKSTIKKDTSKAGSSKAGTSKKTKK